MIIINKMSDFIYILQLKHKIELYLLEQNITYSDLLVQLNKNKNIKHNHDDIYFTDEKINTLLSDDDFDDGLYGIINYTYDLNYNTMLKYGVDNKYTYYNKPLVVKKLIKDNKITEVFINDNYEILELFKKDDDNISKVNQFYLLKNGSLKNINKEMDIINIDNNEDDIILTKIYKFKSETKISLNRIYDVEMYKDIFEEEDEYNEIREIINEYNKMVEGIEKNKREVFNNFSMINILIKKNDNDNYFSINDFLLYDFKDVIKNIKISNRLNISEYNEQIEKYFGLEMKDIMDNIKQEYNIDNRLMDCLTLFMDILIRIYIDRVNKYETYSLSKNLLEMIPLNIDRLCNQMTSKSLVKRYWMKILESDENINIIHSMFSLLKTYNLMDLINYVNNIMKEIEPIMVKDK